MNKQLLANKFASVRGDNMSVFVSTACFCCCPKKALEKWVAIGILCILYCFKVLSNQNVRLERFSFQILSQDKSLGKQSGILAYISLYIVYLLTADIQYMLKFVCCQVYGDLFPVTLQIQ